MGRARENPVRLSMHDGPRETAEYMRVNTWGMLDWTVGFFHKTAEINLLAYSCSTSECTRWHTVMADRDELCKNSNPLQGLNS